MTAYGQTHRLLTRSGRGGVEEQASLFLGELCHTCHQATEGDPPFAGDRRISRIRGIRRGQRTKVPTTPEAVDVEVQSDAATPPAEVLLGDEPIGSA